MEKVNAQIVARDQEISKLESQNKNLNSEVDNLEDDVEDVQEEDASSESVTVAAQQSQTVKRQDAQNKLHK